MPRLNYILVRPGHREDVSRAVVALAWYERQRWAANMAQAEHNARPGRVPDPPKADQMGRG